jgi:hypothetical protein
MSAAARDQSVAELADYDVKYLATYLRLLDADADGADWRRSRGVPLD